MTKTKPKEIDKQLTFAEEYINCNRNATQAYKKVYGQTLSNDVAAVNASKLLRITKIKMYLKRRFGVLQLDADYVLKNLKYLAEKSKQESTRLQANIWIGKSIGMFKDNYVQQTQIEKEPESSPKHSIEISEKILELLGSKLPIDRVAKIKEKLEEQRKELKANSLNE